MFLPIILLAISIDWLKFKLKLKLTNLEFNVSSIFFDESKINIIIVLGFGSSIILSNAFDEFLLRNSASSIKIIFLFSYKVVWLLNFMTSLIESISIFFFFIFQV